MSKSCCSLVSDRESVPFLRYGPYRPFCAVISTSVPSSPVVVPTTRGSDSSRSAVSSSMVPRSMSLKSEAVRGLTLALPFFAASSSGSTSVTYGP